jgi:hypothetical protein
MCPQTPGLSPEYSHKAGLQVVITSMPLQVRPVMQRRPRGARYDGPDHTWALGLNEAAPWEDVAAGLRQGAESCEGCPCPLCLRRTSSCSEGLERRVASLPSPQQPHFGGWGYKYPNHPTFNCIKVFHLQHLTRAIAFNSRHNQRDQILSQVRNHSKSKVTREAQL